MNNDNFKQLLAKRFYKRVSFIYNDWFIKYLSQAAAYKINASLGNVGSKKYL